MYLENKGERAMPQQKTDRMSKWASVSKGVKLTIAVIPKDWEEATRRCEKENVSPRLGGHQHNIAEGKFRMLLSVVVPCRKDGQAEKCFVSEVLGQESGAPLDVALFAVKEDVHLTCPPALETEICIIGAMEGMCPECRMYNSVVGPSYHLGDKTPVYLMFASSGSRTRRRTVPWYW